MSGIRAIGAIEKGALQNLKEQITADIAIFFSDLDAFELSGLLADSQSPAKAKAGDTAPEDINVEPGPTELIPGPAISELSGVGLKVAVENGKIAIKQPKTIVKEGEEITEAQAGVMAKLNITPMKVGFEPVAAYDSQDDKVYVGIKIDKPGTLEALKQFIAQAINLSLNLSYPTKENITQLLAKANAEEKALSKLAEEKAPQPEDKPATETKSEESKEETSQSQTSDTDKPSAEPNKDNKEETQSPNTNNEKEEKS